MEIPTYKITIDDSNELGINKIAHTATPAIEIKGFAFNTNKKMKFSDDVKMRIAAPVLVPKQIYRIDEDGFEFNVEFEPETVEKLYQRLMSNLTNKDLFNLEHTSEIVPSHILETLFIDSTEKQDFIKQQYNIDIPLSSIWMIVQVTDKDYYNKLKDNEITGFSIEGLLGLSLSQLIKKKQKFNMKKNKFKLSGKKRFNSSKFESDEVLTVITENGAIAPDVAVIVIDDNLEVIEDYTGDVIIEDKKVHIEDGVITEVIPNTESEIETELDKDKEEPLSEETLSEDEEDKEEKFNDEASILAIVQPLIDVLIERIAKLEAQLENDKVDKDSTESEIKMSIEQRVKLGSQFSNIK